MSEIVPRLVECSVEPGDPPIVRLDLVVDAVLYRGAALQGGGGLLQWTDADDPTTVRARVEAELRHRARQRQRVMIWTRWTVGDDRHVLVAPSLVEVRAVHPRSG